MAGLATLGDGLQEFVAPGSTNMHARQLFKALDQIQLTNESKLAEGLLEISNRISSRGVMLLLSDFLVPDNNELTAALRQIRHRGWEIVMLHLIHPNEESLPDGIAFQFQGMENEGAVSCNVEEIRDLYLQRWREHLELVENIANSVRAQYSRVSTATSYLDTLSQFLVQRAG